MAENPKNSLGEEILVDPGTAPEDRAKHPSGEPAKKDDQVSGASFGDAELNDPPIRTNRPDVPVIQRLGTGAGAHTPPQDPNIDADGRFRPGADEQPATAKDVKSK